MNQSMKLTCHTPTAAFAMRIRRMTSGSTKAATRLSPSLCSSNKAKTYSMEEEAKKMKKWREIVYDLMMKNIRQSVRSFCFCYCFHLLLT